ncbi:MULTISPECIES: DNA topoisomerase [Methylosinus]|uniref:DNA topoisomerase n=1 Tax=Methylosinus trichosporium (strain ATCC 35070 / NCIMB 11131 / UNIQEM 75 / OB3b) TaxID=595536 RepID=A0A2D2D2F6_METT3|nr:MULTISPECIES: DNA topoisomerase [Methylosinus]ATQ69187.1 DNA topoisomerase III [Methylosinus trichosporium OB3b]OBS53610.1 DNA topoisomerase III [Methylosinus sp. 3S-1]
MATLIITEKSSQAKDLRAALGARYGQILPAEGHLLRLAEPDEINPAWKSWSCVVLKPDGLYPTRAAAQGNKPAKLAAIRAALSACDDVILATDCDREGQLIGQEILDHLNYRGRVRRALFTAQDPKTLQQAFARLKPNAEMRPLYEAAVARQQADQIFNLSLTRTATKTLLAPGVRGVIGIGRVKTPTLAIVCLRELEIRNFRPEDYFEIVATATVEGGAFLMRHAPAPKMRIKKRAEAETIAAAAGGYRGPLGVTVDDKRQVPPRLFDLPSLQKTCGQRWGWTADKTLSVAQELYDGEGKKLITYPRAEARYLAENQIGDAPAIVAALTRLRGFAQLDIASPVIRRGKSGHFCDKALEGVSHHAVVPNVNVLDDLETRLTRLDDDEKRLFALICRSYLAAVMPDYEYRQTVVTMAVPIPGRTAAEFRAVGRIPLRLGWKAVYQAHEPDAETEAEQTLPALRDGESAVLSDARVEAKRTQPPPRYNEGTLVDAMQNAWRFVEDAALRDRLKEAKGIGTPATRAEIIKGLKRQNLLTADGKLVVPTPAGLQLFELLRGAAPALVDPATTALWEMRLDEVLVGKADYHAVIDGVATAARELIEALVEKSIGKVELAASAPARRRRGAPAATAKSAGAGPRRRGSKTQRAPKAKPPETDSNERGGRSKAPTDKMVAYAENLSRAKKVKLPDLYRQDFDACRKFLDEHAR